MACNWTYFEDLIRRRSTNKKAFTICTFITYFPWSNEYYSSICTPETLIITRWDWKARISIKSVKRGDRNGKKIQYSTSNFDSTSTGGVKEEFLADPSKSPSLSGNTYSLCLCSNTCTVRYRTWSENGDLWILWSSVCEDANLTLGPRFFRPVSYSQMLLHCNTLVLQTYAFPLVSSATHPEPNFTVQSSEFYPTTGPHFSTLRLSNSVADI